MSSRGSDEPRTTERLSRAFRALGHPHRLTLVRALLGRAVACCSGERVDDCVLDPASCNVGELAELVEVAPSTLSHHLKELQDAGVIERAREGRFLYCRVDEELMDELATVLLGDSASSSSAGSWRSARRQRLSGGARG